MVQEEESLLSHHTSKLVQEAQEEEEEAPYSHHTSKEEVQQGLEVPSRPRDSGSLLQP